MQWYKGKLSAQSSPVLADIITEDRISPQLSSIAEADKEPSVAWKISLPDLPEMPFLTNKLQNLKKKKLTLYRQMDCTHSDCFNS